MNRILVVTDEDDTLALEFLDLDDLRSEGIIPREFALTASTASA